MNVNKRIFLYLLLSLTFFTSARATVKDTVYVSDYAGRPNSYTNVVAGLQAAIEKCKNNNAKVLVFDEGRYDIWPEGAARAEYFISNTSTEQECPSKIKTIGLLFKGVKNLTIDGNNALLMFHGKMITMAFDHCENIELKNIRMDFERPTASELLYAKVAPEEIDVKFHPDTRYDIVNDRIVVYGEGWKSNHIHCIEFDPEKETFRYSGGWNMLAQSPAKELSRGLVRFSTPVDFKPKEGNILTVRDVIRDQVGMFILESKDMVLNKVKMHYMHGLGIVNQYVHNITMNDVTCKARAETGRTLASSADMMHFSGCSGKVSVLNCVFDGAHDDPINIHGTNLRVIEQLGGQVVKVRFMHGQSYGFNAFFPGDEVAFVRAKTMERYAFSHIDSVRRISEREQVLYLKEPVPAGIILNADCIENITCTPEVLVQNSYFAHTSTRGLLVTTPRSVVIERNTFYKTGMSAILIEGDAEGWFESGPVRDVLIRENTFVDCAYQGGPGNAVIALNPSNTVIDPERPVHKNVRIERNTFKVFDYPVLYAKSTSGLSFTGNKIIRTNILSPSSGNKYTFTLNGCKDVKIHGTHFGEEVLGRNIKIGNMKKRSIKTDIEKSKIIE